LFKNRNQQIETNYKEKLIAAPHSAVYSLTWLFACSAASGRRSATADPYWRAQLKRLEKRMHRNKAMVAVARRLLVSIWHILTKREPYQHFDEETIAYKMLTFVPLRGSGPGL